MQSNHAGLIPRTSSASALSMEQSCLIQDPISLTVAQELLNRPHNTRRKSAFTIASAQSQQLDGTDGQGQTADAPHEGRSRPAGHSSNTWTSSSGDVISDQDEIDDRTLFVQEYNRLARKHGVRNIVPEEQEPNEDMLNSFSKQSNWFSRKILRRTSSSQSIKVKNDHHLKHMRSISDSLRHKKRDRLKDKDLQDLARLCGLSLLYLPTEYAAGSLAVPTCFRATAQFLVQHAPSTRGVFRIPGSQNTVSALYNHYCSTDEEGQIIAGTVTCPTLPDHIKCDTHDVASAFKRFLAGLPGGILGSLALFSAFISIQTQFQGDAELTRTKQSKVRARLIALAVATLRSQYRRELICAVFGLLSMIGRAAETAPREDERGRPLPTSDLMGYGPLGIVFGPLLVGDLLEDYNIRLVNPHGGLVLLPISPPKSRKERSKKNKSGEEGTTFSNHIDKIKVANSITEMLVTHWRDVVRHMKNTGALKAVAGTQSLTVRNSNPPILRPSASETFALRKPPDWENFGSPLRRTERSVSPTPNRHHGGTLDDLSDYEAPHQTDMLRVQKQRAKQKIPIQHTVSKRLSRTILSPTIEESPRSSSHQGLHSSESKPRSTTRIPSESNVIGPTPRGQGYQKSKEESSVSNESSSGKENKPPSSGYWSILDPGRQISNHDQPDRTEHEQSREQDGRHCTSDRSKFHDVTVKINLLTPEPDTQLNHGGESLVNAALATAKSKPNITPPTKIYPATSTRSELTKASEDQPADVKRDTPRETNKLTKSAKRTQGRDNGIKLGLLKAKHGRHDTSTKKVKKKTSSSQQSSTSGKDAKHPAGQVNMHIKFWPFDRMPGTEPSSAQKANLDIMITRSSSRNPSEQPSSSSRRVGGSEPGLHPHGYLVAPNYRKVSRSVDDNLRQKRKVLEIQRGYLSKDPLSRVSHEEDMASLAELAQALDSEGPIHASPSPRPFLDQKVPGIVTPVRQKLGTSRRPCSPHFESQQKGKSSLDERRSQFDTEFVRSTDVSPSKQELPSRKLDSNQTQESSPRGLNNDQNVQIRPRKRTGSPRSPSSKISALVAKYNNGNSAPILPPAAPLPPRSPSKPIPRDPSGKIEAFKDGIVAPYTINPPTPTRSQMSVRSSRSDKTKQPNSTPEATRRSTSPERDTSPSKVPVRSKVPVPKRVLRSSLDDKTPLRIVQKIDENTSRPATGSSSKIPRARFDGAGSSPNNFDCSTSKLISRASSQSASVGPADTTALVVQRLARSTSRTLTPPLTFRRSLDDAVTEIRGPRPSILYPATLHSVRETTDSNSDVNGFQQSDFEPSQPPLEMEGNAAFDGPAGDMRIHPYPKRATIDIPIRVSPRVPVNSPNFVHPDSPFQDNFSHPGSPPSSPLDGRSSSNPYREITWLQRQLATERKEILQMKKQLDARKDHDSGNLVEELREARKELIEVRKELDKWKTRAKLAEEQPEIALRDLLRGVSTQLTYRSGSRVSDRNDTSRTDGPSDYFHRTQSLRDVFNGTDGAASQEGSQDSSDTVIRELYSSPTVSEYSIWIDRAMTAVEEMGGSYTDSGN